MVTQSSTEAVGSEGNKLNPTSGRGSTSFSAQSEPANSASSSSVTNDKVARTTKSSGKSSKTAKRPEPRNDTEVVADAGNTIEPAQVGGTQTVAPATEVEDSEGSGLSRTGVQILTWLALSSLLMGWGAAVTWRGRTREPAVST
jgi:hypothetical protein